MKNKKANRGVGNEAKKNKLSIFFLSARFMEICCKMRYFKFWKKIPPLLVLFLFLVFFWFFFLLERMCLPSTCNRRSALLSSYFLFIYSVMCIAQEMRFYIIWHPGGWHIVHFTLIVVQQTSLWYLCWCRVGAVVMMCCICLPAASDGVLWCWLCHWSGKEDKRELF